MKGDRSSAEPHTEALLSVFYAGAPAGVDPSARANAALELQRIYHMLTAERAPVPSALESFIADLGRMVFGSRDPQKALRSVFGKDLKEGRPRNTEVNRDRALRMHRLVQAGMTKDAAAAQLDTTPDQSDARKYLRAYEKYRSLAIEAAAEEAWHGSPECDDPLEAASKWIAEPMNGSTTK